MIPSIGSTRGIERDVRFGPSRPEHVGNECRHRGHHGRRDRERQQKASRLPSAKFRSRDRLRRHVLCSALSESIRSIARQGNVATLTLLGRRHGNAKFARLSAIKGGKLAKGYLSRPAAQSGAAHAFRVSWTWGRGKSRPWPPLAWEKQAFARLPVRGCKAHQSRSASSERGA